jgi:hypothetical protein
MRLINPADSYSDYVCRYKIFQRAISHSSMVFGPSVRWISDYFGWKYGCTQFLHTNVKRVSPELLNDRLVPNPYVLTIHHLATPFDVHNTFCRHRVFKWYKKVHILTCIPIAIQRLRRHVPAKPKHAVGRLLLRNGALTLLVKNTGCVFCVVRNEGS